MALLAGTYELTVDGPAAPQPDILLAPAGAKVRFAPSAT